MTVEPDSAGLPGLFVPVPAVIRAARMLTDTERLLLLRRSDGRALGHSPGQFVQVSIFGLEEAPISICSAAGDGGGSDFELCIRRAGKLTGALHDLPEGAEIGVRGPFGRGFPVDELAGMDVLFIAGGIGLAPMRSLIRNCLTERGRFGGLTLLYGAKKPREMLFRDELQQWGSADDFDVRLIVDEAEPGWDGAVGLITELLEPLEVDAARTAAVIVGPPVMYRFVIDLLRTKSLPPQRIIVSLERYMRCGVGKCGHCMIGPEIYCCLDGPVFLLSELAGVTGAI